MDVADDVEKLEFVIKDSDVVGSDFMGRVEVPVDKVTEESRTLHTTVIATTQILDGKVYTDTCVLVDEKNTPIHKHSKAKLSFAVKYVSIDTVRANVQQPAQCTSDRTGTAAV